MMKNELANAMEIVKVGDKELVKVVEGSVEVKEKVKKVSLRQDFLKGFSTIVSKKEEIIEVTGMELEQFDKMVEYFETQINKTKTVSKGEYKPTEKASAILDILIAFEGEYKTGKEIAEASQGILKANGVSGSIRGLVTNGFVEATNDSPKKYKITQKGIDFLNDEE